MNRRGVIQGGAVVGSGAAALSAFGAENASAAEDYRESIPEDVYLVYDEAKLKELEPHLVSRTLNVLPQQVYGAIATTGTEDLTSTGDRDTNIAMFWVEYPYQEGFTPFESHLGDHEPFYVEYEPKVGGPEITRVLCSGYHWITARYTKFDTVEENGNDHPLFRIADRYHHYFGTTEDGTTPSSAWGLADLRGELQGWLDNDWPVNVPSITNPWVQKTRSSWWEDTTGDFRVGEAFYDAALSIGIFGADQTDL